MESVQLKDKNFLLSLRPGWLPQGVSSMDTIGKKQEKHQFSLSETCPGATETLLFVDSMYPATVLAIWLEKHLRKLLRRAWDPNS